MDQGSRVGDVLQGRYKILQFLGRGGMGAVFLCEDMRLPGKQWAVKEMLIYDTTVAEQVEESFKREASMLARLRHRNLPIIVDYFLVAGKQYLVMEFIEGETLARVVNREGPVDETTGLRWALELAQVLDYLHRQEKPVIFRDLKPENVIVSNDRHMKLVDFGLARQFDPAKRRDTQASGSVGYAPPEQWEDANQTDERSDIYSLGATLYYALTGKPPSPIYGSHRLRPHRPDIEAGTEAVVLRCLQPDPSNRYSGTGELIRDLLLLLSRERHQKDAPRLAPRAVEPAAPAASSAATPRALPASLAPRFAAPVRLAEPGDRLTTPSWLRALLLMATLLWVGGAALGLIHPSAAGSGPETTPVQASLREKDEARQAIGRGDEEAAISILDRVVTSHPADAEAHILKSNAYVLLQHKPYLRIPVVTSLTGADQEGYQLLSGLALSQAELNQSGGVHPRGGAAQMLVLEVYDDASRLDRLLELAGQICAEPAYTVAIGPFTSQQAIAVAPVFDTGKLALVTPAASDPRIWKAGPYLFTCAESDVRRERALAEYFVGEGLTQGAVFQDEESLISGSEATEFSTELTRAGGKVVLEGTYQESALDFRPLISQLDKSSAQFVFLSEYRSSVTARFAHELRSSGSHLALSALTAPFSQKLLELGGKDVEGLWTSTYFHPEIPDHEIQTFTRRYEQAFGPERPSHREAYAYDTLGMVAQAITEVGNDRQAIRDWLASLGDSRPPYPGVTGKFAPSRPLDLRPAYLVQVQNGAYILRLPKGN